MILIVDANIIISALIRDSKSRELLITTSLNLYSPDTLLESIEKHKNEFIEKSGLTNEEFETLLNFLLENIIIIKQEEYASKLELSKEIMKDIDIEDANYIALALLIVNDGIWSDDKHFKQQDKIKIYTTNELVDFLE